jgi:hypothetical protein
MLMKFIHTIFSSLLAVLVLISSSSFTVNMHACGGKVQSVSVIEKAEACAMELDAAPTCHQSIAKKKTCCKEDQLTFEGKIFKVQESTSLQLQQAFWVVELPLITTISVSPNAVSEFQFLRYSPPLIDRDITIQVQSFLI